MYETKDLTPEMLAALVDASAAINSAQNLDETLASIARAAAAVLRSEGSSVIMLDKTRGRQVFRAAVGDRADQLIGMEYEADAGISGKVLQTGQAEIVEDVSHDNAHLKDIDSQVGFQTRSVLAAPLIHDSVPLGVVEVVNPIEGGHFHKRDMQLAMVFANLAAITVANSQLRERLRMDNRGLKESLPSQSQMIGVSGPMENVRNLIGRVGRSNSTVLLLGETGTGKELAARLVHSSSPRSERPFIAVNCAALSETLLESELFGHEAGAFTGATGLKLGRFELADGGTLFLDEVAEISPDIQAKLLRVLQEREIVRVGGVKSIGCDVRVVAATNRNLAEEMAAGRFRKDLFFRLNVFPIELPALRDRREDIPLLASYFLKQLAGEMNIPTPELSSEAAAALRAYEFPGNIRELQNVLERACLLCCNFDDPADKAVPVICPEHLPREFFGGLGYDEASSHESVLAAGERAMIIDALRANSWNQSQAARALGISRDNIRYRIKKYDIKRPL